MKFLSIIMISLFVVSCAHNSCEVKKTQTERSVELLEKRMEAKRPH